jgi:hypothetical protein
VSLLPVAAVPPTCPPSREAIREALGVGRILFEGQREAGSDGVRLANLEAAGKTLATAVRVGHVVEDEKMLPPDPPLPPLRVVT